MSVSARTQNEKHKYTEALTKINRTTQKFLSAYIQLRHKYLSENEDKSTIIEHIFITSIILTTSVRQNTQKH